MKEDYKKILGEWVYRSVHNDTDIEKSFEELEYGRGILTVEDVSDDCKFKGRLVLRFDANYILNLSGEILHHDNKMNGIRMKGKGIKGLPTEEWEYDYRGFVIPDWPNGVNQAFVITGSVDRAKDHDTAKAGYVGTFFMVHKNK